MRLLSKLIVTVVMNGFALLVAMYFLPGFSVLGGPKEWAIVALILTALNVLVKPVLKLVLGPIILLTLGLALLLVNWLVLYILDAISHNLYVAPDGYAWTLFLASLIVGVANIFLHWARRRDH